MWTSLSPTRVAEPLGVSVTNIKWLCELFSSSRRFSSLCILCPIDSIEEVFGLLTADDIFVDVDGVILAPVPGVLGAGALPCWWCCSRPLVLLPLLCLYSGSSCMSRAYVVSCLRCISLLLPLLRAGVSGSASRLLYVCVWFLCTQKFSLWKFLSFNLIALYFYRLDLINIRSSTIIFLFGHALVFFLIELSLK